MNCIVCGKPVPFDGANVCGTRCLIRESKQQEEKAEGQPNLRRNRPRAVNFAQRMQSMVMSPTPVTKEVEMLKIAHRWKRNVNEVVGNTVFSFDDKGVATVQDIGNARLDLEALLKKNGFFVPEEKTEEKAPPPAPKVEKKPVAAPPPPKEVVANAEASESEEKKSAKKPLFRKKLDSE